MKKAMRIIALILTVTLIAVSSCSCNALDTLKSNHGYWNDNGGITLGENEYKLLPSLEYFIPEINYNTQVSITDKDVPVLAGAFVGMKGYISDDRLIIEFSAESEFYCRADKDDEIINRMNGGVKFDNYCYSYEVFNDEGEWETCWYILTDEQKKAVDNVLNTVTPTQLPDMASMVSEFFLYLEECSSDLLFRREISEIQYSDGKFYFVEYADDGTYLREVPAEYNDIFEKICEKKIESDYDFYSEDYEYEENVMYDYSA